MIAGNEHHIILFYKLLVGDDSGGGSTTVAAVHDGYVLQKVLCIVGIALMMFCI